MQKQTKSLLEELSSMPLHRDKEEVVDKVVEKQVELTIPLSVTEDKIGLFIGPKGANLKKFIIGATKRSFKGEDIGKVFCNIQNDQTQNPPVLAVLKASSNEVMEVLKDNVLKHESVFMRKMKNRDKPRKYNTKYVFKTSMENHMVPKFIGSKGRNINNLTSQILLSDNCHTNEEINVSICQDKKIRMQYLTFEHLTTEVECDEKVLITVEMNTSDRKASLDVVRDIVKQAVENTNSNSYTRHQPQYEEYERQPEEGSGFLEEL